MRRLVLSRLALLVLGLLLAVLLFELGHRVLGVAMPDRAQPVSADWSQGPVILCVGDSHTYGTSVEREESYPARLQQELDAISPRSRFRVVNHGTPGMNSSQLAEILPIWLAEYRPALVVVWIGRNDVWNREDPAHLHPDGAVDWTERLLGWSRLYRVLRTYSVAALWKTKATAPAEIRREVRRDSWQWVRAGALDADAYQKRLEQGLGALVTLLQDAEQAFLLLTYPQVGLQWRGRGDVHRRVARELARTAGVPLIDTSLDLERARQRNPDAELLCRKPFEHPEACLFLLEMGPHPAPPLYREIAVSVALAVVQRLGTL